VTTLDKVQRFQAATRDCPRVYAVLITCEGETDVAWLWETQAAAKMCADQHNSIKGNATGYYGRARVVSMPVKTEKMARDLYSSEGERNG
jgi:hypothetical protein